MYKRQGHGSQNFVEGAQNSCNPVFIEVGLRLGVENYYKYFRQFGLFEKTGIDLPGEANTIMHKMENMGNVELATVSFGQSFQITPIQLATTVSALINGGNRVTPHFGTSVLSSGGKTAKELLYPVEKGVVSEKTSETVREILEKVVSEGSGRNAAVQGYRIGGKTATSQTLPRSANRYISSFLGFAPANDPQVLALCIICLLYTSIFFPVSPAASLLRFHLYTFRRRFWNSPFFFPSPLCLSCPLLPQSFYININ